MVVLPPQPGHGRPPEPREVLEVSEDPVLEVLKSQPVQTEAMSGVYRQPRKQGHGTGLSRLVEALEVMPIDLKAPGAMVKREHDGASDAVAAVPVASGNP